MTLRPPEDIIAGRPDGAVAFAGGEGNLLLQDGAKAVFRGGVTSESGDFDVFQHDLVGDGDLIIPLDDVGGASLVNAGVVSLGDSGEPEFDSDPQANPTDASRPFTVTIEDLAKGADVLDPDESDVLLRRTPDAQQDVEQTRIGNGIFSDNGRIIISHAGLPVGENLINGSFNVQSGSTDAVQVRGSDGTLQDPASSEDFAQLGDAISAGFEALAASSTTFETGVPVGTNASEGDVLASLDTRSDAVVTISLDTEAVSSSGGGATQPVESGDDGGATTGGDDGGGGLQTDGGMPIIDIQVQTSPNSVSWFDNATTPDATTDSDLTGIMSYRKTFRTGSRFVRVVLDTPASEEAQADIAIESGG